MNIEESLLKLLESIGIANTSSAEQFIHQFGLPIMVVVCLFLIWFCFSIKKNIEARQIYIRKVEPVKTTLPGTVFKVLVKEGVHIAKGDVVAVIEAMEMKTEIKSHKGGIVESVEVEVGKNVESDQVLITIA